MMQGEPPDDHVRVLTLGAGREVGKSCVVVSLGGKRILFDCGEDQPIPEWL